VKVLTSVRSRGYAINQEERYDGVVGVAAPVLDRHGIAHAAVGVQGPTMRMTAEKVEAIAPLVRAAAQEIAQLALRP